MLRARFPLAVAALAAAVALVPAGSASAAESGGLPGLPTQVQDALDQLGGGAGGSGSDTPDLPGAVTDLTDCLAEAPTTEPEDDGTETDETSTEDETTTQNNTPTAPETSRDGAATPDEGTQENPLQDVTPKQQSGLTTQSSGDVTVLAAETDPITDPILAGEDCIFQFFEDLGAAQAQCFEENNFTVEYLVEKLEAAEPPSPDDLTEFQENLTGLLACLQGGPDETDTGGTPPPSSGGGEAAAPSDVAPAATPVSGTPNFTG